jgi:hypothetical protein
VDRELIIPLRAGPVARISDDYASHRTRIRAFTRFPQFAGLRRLETAAQDRRSMDATATGARTKAAVALLTGALTGLVLLALAGPAPAQESVAPDSAAQESAEPPMVEEDAVVGEEPAESVAVETEDSAELPAATQGFEAGPTAELRAAVQPESAGPTATAEEELQPAAAPDGAPPEPEPAVAPKRAVAPESQPAPDAAGRNDEPHARLLAHVQTRLDAVERGVRDVHKRLDAGAAPAPRQLDRLRTGVQRLRVALGQLRRESASHPEPTAVPDALQARLRRVRAAAVELVASLTTHAGESTQAAALINQLLALEGLPARPAPAEGAGRRAFHTRARPAPGTAGLAYTQAIASQAQPQSGATPLSRQPPASADEAPASPRRSPGGPRAPYGSAAAAPAASFFSVAGPAALALLLGLAIPRVVRRLVLPPVTRPPEPIGSPRERPG